MFVRNKTPFKVGLTHGGFAEGHCAGALVVVTTYRATPGKLTLCDAPPRVPTDPPDLSRQALWSGTSVTAAGDVYGPQSGHFQRIVSLAVGDVFRRLLVSGDRHWTPGLTGELEPSAPARFERIALSFARAYGGFVDVPPGLFPGSDLPFPGGRLAYPLNEGGVGFYLDKAAATGRALPNIEIIDHPVRQWSDRPMPGGFGPCPDLPALRMSPPERHEQPTGEQMFAGMFRGIHHAPGYLIFDALRPGTPIEIEGVGQGIVHFEVPPPPVRVTLRRAAGLESTRAELRSVHVDADRAMISCVHGYGFFYRDGDAPTWVLVEH
jgi:hypothetical protein